MSKRWITFAGLFLAATALTLPAVAAPKTAKPVAGPKTKASAPKTKAVSAKGAKPTVKPLKTTTKASKPLNAAAAKTKTKTSTTTAAANTTTTGVASTTTSPSATAWTPTNPVAQKLSTKSNLVTKVQGALPAGTDLNLATAGFKNFGQFIAAVNVSSNHNIPFADLKAAMTGQTMAGTLTGEPVLSLGRAIQKLKPGLDATAEAQKAQTQANAEID
jgi:hypothetical protein